MPMVGGGDRGGKRERELLRPGPYLIALVWFQRKTANNGNEYLNCKFQICGGQSQGKEFFSMMGLDVANKPGIATRWEIWCNACNITERFELGTMTEDTDAEGDENIRRLFMGVPFACDVTKETRGQYTNNGIGQYIFPKNWRPQWHEWARDWVDARNARSRRAPEDDLEDPAPADDYSYATPAPVDDGFEPAPPPPPRAMDEDDDIPF